MFWRFILFCATAILLLSSFHAHNHRLAVEALSTMKTPSPVVSMHWFRKGLRLHDNPGLLAATRVQDVTKCYPVYILDGDSYQLKHCTALRANFLVECLQDLDGSLRKRGSRLYVGSGDPVEVLPQLWSKWGITHLMWEEDETGEPYAKERDAKVLEQAKECGIHVQTFASETLHPLQKYVDLASSKSVPYTMTSFQTLFGKMGKVPKPKPRPQSFPPCGGDEEEDSEFMLPPRRATDLPWPRSIPKEQATPLWGPADLRNMTPIVRGGERLAIKQLKRKVLERPNYVSTFEKPKTSCVAISKNDNEDNDNAKAEAMSTTVLSPYLAWGCLSPRTMWHAVSDSNERSSTPAGKRSKPPVSLHGQMLWRDFNHLIAHDANRNEPGSWGRIEGNKYCRPVPWDEDPQSLDAWKQGLTGYPWIDACMKQLEQEGWIHHLGRHAVACFVTRGDLWQNWEKGAQHFESHLLDADYALNGFNWLWLSCSGFFYQYFRCYSPIAFQKKNDPTGQYIKKYLPQLKELPTKYIYEPWKAPVAVQNQAGVRIGKDYPRPIVDHAVVSKENMNKMKMAYDEFKKGNAGSGTSKTNGTTTKKRVSAAEASTSSSTKSPGPTKKKQRKLTDY